MDVYVVLLTVAVIGILTVAAVLFNEQLGSRVLSKKFLDLQNINKKIDAEAAGLRKENEDLKDKSIVLGQEIRTLTEALRSKEEEINKIHEADENRIAVFIDKTLLRDIMTTQVVTVEVDAPFVDVARKMQEFDIRHLPIVDEKFKLVGIITQRMLYQIHSPRKLMDGEWYYDEEMLNGHILRNVMEKEVVSLMPEHSLGKALMKMAYSKCGAIPIVDLNNTLMGIVTRKDILKIAAKIYQKKNSEV